MTTPPRREQTGERRTCRARRLRYGQEVVSVPDSRSRSNATKWAGHSPRPARDVALTAANVGNRDAAVGLLQRLRRDTSAWSGPTADTPATWSNW
jgi:hypothetical protein